MLGNVQTGCLSLADGISAKLSRHARKRWPWQSSLIADARLTHDSPIRWEHFKKSS